METTYKTILTRIFTKTGQVENYEYIDTDYQIALDRYDKEVQRMASFLVYVEGHCIIRLVDASSAEHRTLKTIQIGNNNV